MNLTILAKIDQAARPLTNSEASWIIGMLIAFLVGYFIGLAWKARTHDREIESILRITKRKEEAMLTARKGPPMVFQANLDPFRQERERAPKNPAQQIDKLRPC